MIGWNRGIASSCIFCQDQMESQDHLFFDCPFSTTIWDEYELSHKLLNQNYTTSFVDILSLLSTSLFNNSTCFIQRYDLQATVHKIWHERNRHRHVEIPHSSGQIVTFIDRLVRNRISSIRMANPSRLQDGLRLWFHCRN